MVKVKDNGKGNLLAEAKYVGGPIVFENIYKASPDSVVFEGKKILKGQELKDSQFTFELLDENNKVIQTIKNNSNGQIIFDEITYEKAGEYKYTVREVNDNQTGVTYDDKEFGIVVYVTDNGKGNLSLKIQYVDGNIEFNNTYKAPPITQDKPSKREDSKSNGKFIKGIPSTGVPRILFEIGRASCRERV